MLIRVNMIIESILLLLLLDWKLFYSVNLCIFMLLHVKNIDIWGAIFIRLR